jgi:thymidylate kinase
MIIILEGPDGAGKSTLSETLRQHLQKSKMTHVVKHGPYLNISPEELCRIYFRSMSNALTYDDHVILDRSWLSEPIYGNIYRKGINRLDVPRRRMLERTALARGAVVIQCQPDFEVCKQSFMLREKDEYLDTIKQLSQVYAEYESLGQTTALPIMHYDYTVDSIEDLLAKLKTKSIENKAAGGGSFNKGNILMLCDKGPRTNVRASAAVIPFINFLDNDGPSRMLAETLERENIPENKIYWINTQTYQGTPTSANFIKDLKPSKIFALGNNAYMWAINNDVQATKLPPPLYHMQNYPNQPYTFLESDYGNNGNKI